MILQDDSKESAERIRNTLRKYNREFFTDSETINLYEEDGDKLIGGLTATRDFDSIYIVYTNFDSMLSQTPHIKKILPPEIKRAEKSQGYILYEPSPEAVLDAVIPEYISGMIYSAVSESYASELAARRTAMDSASKNAEEMIDDLSLKYNRARQNAITQEITEIVAGAEG